MTNLIDLEGERKKPRKKPQEPPGDDVVSLFVCECGCAMWRLYADAEGSVECLNCGGCPPGLRSVCEDVQAG